MKYFFISVLMTAHAASQSSWIIEFGFRGIIPEVINQPYVLENEKLININQHSLPQRDYVPFPWIAQGFIINFLNNYDKFSFGVGYEFHYDYHSFVSNNDSGVDAFTAKIQNNIFYVIARLNLKHDYQHSIFIGAKIGLMLVLEGYSSDLGVLNSLAVGEEEKFAAYEINNVSPGLYAAIQFGIKFYFYRNPKIKVLPGVNIIAELGGATPTIATGKQILNNDKNSVVRIDNAVKYRSNYSNLGIKLLFFLEIVNKKPFFFKMKKREPPDYQEY